MTRSLFQQAHIGLACLDRELHYVLVNDSLAAMNGIPAAAHVGKHVADVVPTLSATAEAVAARILATGAPQIDHPVTGETAACPGERRWWTDSWYPLRDGSGDIVGFGVTVQDITLLKRSEEARRASEAELLGEATALGDLYELSGRLFRTRTRSEGINLMLDGVIRLLAADKGNVQLFDQERGVLVLAAHRGFGDEFVDVFQEVSAGSDTACGRALQTGATVVIEDVEVDAEYAPLRPIARSAGYRGVISTPLITAEGPTVGMLSVHFASPHRPSATQLQRLDLYARRAAGFIERCQLEKARQDSEERARLALDAASAGCWAWDPHTDQFACDARVNALLGYPSDHRPTFEGWLNRVPQSDRLRLLARVEQMLRTPGDDEWREEYPVVHPNGTTVWIAGLGRIERDVDGRVVRFTGIDLDVTARKRGEESLHQTQAALEARVEARTRELQQRTDQLRHLASALTMAEQHAREGLAKILHDDVQQFLIAARMHLEPLIRDGSHERRRSAEILSMVTTHLDEALAATRALSVELSPPALRTAGLVAAFERLAAQMRDRYGLQVGLSLDPAAEPDRYDVRVLVFESVRELLFNVVKHASVREATLELASYGDRLFRITVADHGSGLDVDSVTRPRSTSAGGLGLVAIRERVVLFGGILRSRARGATARA